MKYLYLIISAGLFISLYSCKDDETVTPEVTKDRTVIIYMAAENTLAEYTQSDLDELFAGEKDIPDNSQIIVYKDDNTLPIIYRITNTGHSVWKNYVKEVDSADSTGFADVIKEIVSSSHSSYYGIVLWSHGSSWRDNNFKKKSFGVDNNANSLYSDVGSELTIASLHDILHSIPNLDYIMFDACYMQSVEVCYELKDCANWIIGSPTEIPAGGAPYDLITKELCNGDIEGIVEKYHGYYSTKTNGVLLSTVKCDEMENFAKYTSDLLQEDSTIEWSLDNCQIYAPIGNSNLPVPYDIRSTLHNNLLDLRLAEWEEQWQKTILYPQSASRWASAFSSSWGDAHKRLTDPNNYGAISWSIPSTFQNKESWATTFKTLGWYKAVWNGKNQ